MFNLIEIKICILGKTGTGKTSLSNRLINRENYIHYLYQEPTIGASFSSVKIKNGNNIYKFDIWDTAGQERYKSLAPMYYKKAKIALIVYDITDYESFLEIDYWIKELKNNTNGNIVILLLGNKYDMKNKMKIEDEMIKKYSNENNIQNIYCSAFNGENCDKIFEIIIKNIKIINGKQIKNINLTNKDINSLDKPRYLYNCC